METTPAATIEKIEKSYAQILRLYRSVPVTALIEPMLANGWSVKDTLAHIAAWEWRCASLLNAAHQTNVPLKAMPDVGALNREIYQIALNYCRSYLRRKRLLTIPWLRQTEEAPDLPDFRPGPESSALRGEYRYILWEAVQNLSAPLREVITLHYYMELPAVEIAAMLNCPEGTIYSRLHNARRRLAETLAEKGLTTPEMLEAQNAH